MALKLGWMLVNANLVTEAQLQEALDYQKKNGGRLGYNLVKLGFCTEDGIPFPLKAPG